MSRVYGKAKYRDDLKNVVLFFTKTVHSDVVGVTWSVDGYFKQEGHDGPGSLT